MPDQLLTDALAELGTKPELLEAALADIGLKLEDKRGGAYDVFAGDTCIATVTVEQAWNLVCYLRPSWTWAELQQDRVARRLEQICAGQISPNEARASLIAEVG